MEATEKLIDPLEHTSETHVNPDRGKSERQLILENEKFAYSVLNKEFSQYMHSNKREDMMSAALYGLVYAAQKYNTEQNDTKFISYAVHWIRYYINEEIRNFSLIRFNQNFVTKRNKVIRATDKYKKEHNGMEPSAETLSEETGLSEKVVNNIKNVNNCENFKFISFQTNVDSPKVKDNADLSVEDKVMKEYLDNAVSADIQTKVEFEDMLYRFKQTVNPVDYGIFVDKHLNGLSFSEIADKYNLKFASSASYRLKCAQNEWVKLLNK